MDNVKWLETQPAGNKSLAVAERIGKCIVELHHGNACGNTTPYVRTPRATMTTETARAKSAAPKVVYTDMVCDIEVDDAPCNSRVIGNKQYRITAMITGTRAQDIV